ncbi:uncharacterized protein LOC116118674 [Pistacia vera]|uniref:uncharacterized protein LOC116118674 n=1 Tax=Pistacia vera TaxID=55513 RepID=UPI0012638AAE|nr:uncharacterized protein LOC116118674 [Pistacia vera]
MKELIGRVSSELYALGAGTWNLERVNVGNCSNRLKVEEWMQNYCNVLCVNSWQVKRYIDVYSASSVIGFSCEDLLHISDLYAQAEKNRSCCSKKLLSNRDEICNSLLPYLKRQIDAYSNFLLSVADLARCKWTEFNLEMMGIGFGIMLISILVHILAIKRMKNSFGVSLSSFGDIF